MHNRWLTWQAAAIAASGLVTLGAIAVAQAEQQPASGMSSGQTTTSTTPLKASPSMKATRPSGF